MPRIRAGYWEALRARRVCATCRTERPYYIPRSLGECTPCASPEDTS